MQSGDVLTPPCQTPSPTTHHPTKKPDAVPYSFPKTPDNFNVYAVVVGQYVPTIKH